MNCSLCRTDRPIRVRLKVGSGHRSGPNPMYRPGPLIATDQSLSPCQRKFGCEGTYFLYASIQSDAIARCA